ncbi:MAG: Eco57I restriction-modification methylase domain-containing protein [Promethearchaeota archaeon]
MPFSPKTLNREFNYKSKVAHAAIAALYNSMSSPSGGTPEREFREWREFYENQCGYDLEDLEPRPFGQGHTLDVENADPIRLLFCTHTYISIVVEFLTVEVGASAMRDGGVSWLGELLSSGGSDFREKLSLLADGKVAGEFGLELNVNPAFFHWHVGLTNPGLEGAIRLVARTVSKVVHGERRGNLGERGSVNVDAEPTVRGGVGGEVDFLRDLYSDLIPKKLRHDLGEFFTPEWLALEIIESSGYRGHPESRVLDPSCGSGVVLLLAVARVVDKMGGQGIEPGRITGYVTRNIVGLEVNPLSALLAQANYAILLARLGLLGSAPRPVSIPVFCADILSPSGGNLNVWFARGVSGLGAALPPPLRGKFDFVLGNPPWVGWESLDRDYRERQKPLWEEYGLFVLDGMSSMLGGGRKDLSMLFTYVAADRFLKTGGRLTFLITSTVFRSKAGGGFRRFLIRGVQHALVDLQDFKSLQPFEGATTQTALFTIVKGCRPEFPVEGRVWSAARCKLPDCTSREFLEVLVFPVDGGDATSPLILVPKEDAHYRDLLGPSGYKAREGVNPLGCQGIFLVRVIGREGNLLVVENQRSIGKNKYRTFRCTVEPDLLYPVVRSSDFGRVAWAVHPKGDVQLHILMVQDVDKQRGIPLQEMLDKYPATAAFLEHFKPELEARKGLWRYFSKVDRKTGEKSLAAPYYSLFNVTRDILAPYKVIWKRMGNTLSAGIVESLDTDGAGVKPVLPLDIFAFVPCDSLEEALFVSGILNSSPAKKLLSLVTEPGKSLASPGILKYLSIDKYRPGDPVHEQVVRAAKALRDAIVCGRDPPAGGPGRLDAAAERYFEHISFNQQVF